MSWIIPEEYDNWERCELELEEERVQARKLLADTGHVAKVIFTDCMIPLQIDAFLHSGEMCYGRNSRVGGNVILYVFEQECDLSKGWPTIIFQAERVSNATNYVILATEMIVLIDEYLKSKNRNVQ